MPDPNLPFRFLKLCCLFWALIVSSITFAKTGANHPRANEPAGKHSAEVIDKWLSIQIRLERNAIQMPAWHFSRCFAYSGIAAFEALASGLTATGNTSELWNGLTDLPQPEKFKSYYCPASVNATLAFMNRKFFPDNQAAIDSLEEALNDYFLVTEDPQKIRRSNQFGLAIAVAVFNWAENDGYKSQCDSNEPIQCWSNRTVIANSGKPLPVLQLEYCEDSSSPFYEMARQLYDASLNLSADEKEIALFWRDIPGTSTTNHWLCILQQVLKQSGCCLDKAAFSYAIIGSCLNDAAIHCRKANYHSAIPAPATYIREILGHQEWNPLGNQDLQTEFPSEQATIAAAISDALTVLFGDPGNFTDHSNDCLGQSPRTFVSFHDIGKEAANAGLFDGTHYKLAIDMGWQEGRMLAKNIFKKLHFLGK